jgi:hypothetical protein
MLATGRDIIAEPVLVKARQSPAALELKLERNVPIVKSSTTAAITAIASFFRRKRPPNLPGESHPNETDTEKPGGPVCTAQNIH